MGKKLRCDNGHLSLTLTPTLKKHFRCTGKEVGGLSPIGEPVHVLRVACVRCLCLVMSMATERSLHLPFLNFLGAP